MNATYADPDTGIVYGATLPRGTNVRGPVSVTVDGNPGVTGTWNGHEIVDVPIPRDVDAVDAMYCLRKLSQQLRDGAPACGVCGGLLPDACHCSPVDAWRLVAADSIPAEGERVLISWRAGHPHYRDTEVARLDGWDWVLEDDDGHEDDETICLTTDRAPSHWMPWPA